MIRLAWGNRVNATFRTKIVLICDNLGIDPSYLMSCMAFESAETFSPGIKNMAGSGAVGLIQFMSSTAIDLGTTTDRLAAMSAVDQLDYVQKYFSRYVHRLKTLEDTYMAILFPAAIGKPPEYILFSQTDTDGHIKAYLQNKGLDWNKDGNITKYEASLGVRKEYDKGMKSGFIFEGEQLMQGIVE